MTATGGFVVVSDKHLKYVNVSGGCHSSNLRSRYPDKGGRGRMRELGHGKINLSVSPRNYAARFDIKTW